MKAGIAKDKGISSGKIFLCTVLKGASDGHRRERDSGTRKGAATLAAYDTALFILLSFFFCSGEGALLSSTRCSEPLLLGLQLA